MQISVIECIRLIYCENAFTVAAPAAVAAVTVAGAVENALSVAGDCREKWAKNAKCTICREIS